MTEEQCQNMANGILDFAGKIWKLQQEAKEDKKISLEVVSQNALSSG
jgi:hypothetical protein